MTSIQIGWNPRSDPETRSVKTREWCEGIAGAGVPYGVEFAMPMLGEAEDRWAAFTQAELDVFARWSSRARSASWRDDYDFGPDDERVESEALAEIRRRA